jgi:hypothetical protein
VPGADQDEAAREARRARWRKRTRPILLVVGVLLTALNFWVCVAREQGKEREQEREGLRAYLTTSYRELHKQTESVLSGLAGLVDETAPTPAGAVAILDKEIVPSLELVSEQGRVLVPAGEAARVLHSEYLATIAATKADAGKLRAIFAEPAGEVGDQRRRAREVLVGARDRWEAFYGHVVEAGQKTGMVITPKTKDAGPPAAPIDASVPSTPVPVPVPTPPADAAARP